MFTRTRKLVASLGAAGLLAAGVAAVSVHDATPAQAAQRNCYGVYFNVGSMQDIACMGAASKASFVPYTGNTIVGLVNGFCINKQKYGYFKALDIAKAAHGTARGSALAYGGTLRGSICP